MDNAIFHIGGTYSYTERWEFIGDLSSDSLKESDFKREKLASSPANDYTSVFIVNSLFCD